MSGTIIFSLDCEGKWGVADHLSEMHHEHLTDTNLRATYVRILKAFAERNVPATFAGVGLFAMDDLSFTHLDKDAIAQRLPYTKFAIDDLQEGSGEGWRAPWFRDIVGDAHEIASHGATHTPFDAMDSSQVDFELSLLSPQDGSTLVFPRNRIAHLDAIAKRFVGYREAPAHRSRLASLASEIDLTAKSQMPPRAVKCDDAQIAAIPSGYFINWKAHLRRFVPTSVTRLRCRQIMRHAANTGGVAHFWTHPENIATHPATMNNLLGLIEDAANLREAGKADILTQRAYCGNGDGLKERQTAQLDCVG